MYREENQDKQRCLPNLKRQGGGPQMIQSYLYSQVCIFYCKKKISEGKGMGKIQDSSLKGMHKGTLIKQK